MIVTFEREPFGWVHPFYRRRHHHRHVLNDWDNFVRPALETVNTLNQMLQLAHECDLDNRLNRLQRSAAEDKPKDKLEIKMDVQQFKPEELDVKMVDNCVVIEGKHEEKQDEHGFISRHFVRRFQLPEDVKAETVTCNLSSDGVLCISAPRMIEQKKVNERVVPINFTGQPEAVKQQEEQAKAVSNTNTSAAPEAQPNPVNEKLEQMEMAPAQEANAA